MNSLEAKKKELILASDIHRQTLGLEMNLFEYRLGQLKNSYQKLPGFWMLIVPVAGFFMARKLTRTTGKLARGSMGLMAALKLWKIARLFWGGKGPL